MHDDNLRIFVFVFVFFFFFFFETTFPFASRSQNGVISTNFCSQSSVVCAQSLEMSDPFTAASRPRRGVGVGAGPSSDPFAAASAATGGAGAWHAPAPNSLPRAPMAMRGAGDFEPMDAIGSMGSMSSTMPARSNAGAFAPAPAAPSAPAPFFDPAAALAAAGESGAALAANPVAMLAMHKGQELVASSMARYLPGAHALWTSLRLYFRVDNAYVRIKLGRTLFPFMHRRWARQPAAAGGGESAGTEGALAPPDADANAPDLYIPAMAFTSFVLLAGLARGVYGVRFDPEVLSTAMGRSTVLLLFEVAVLRGATYALSVPGVYAVSLDLSHSLSFLCVAIALSLCL